MNEIQPFTFPTTGQPVRTLLLDGEPWFVAADVCTALGYSRVADALRIPDPDDLAAHFVRGDDGLERPGQILNEAALYSLILRSNRPDAKRFKRWITHDVLPAIRKTGSYSLPREMSRLELIDLARDSELARIEAETRAAKAEHRVLEMAPAARMADELLAAEGDYSLRDAAQILSRSPSITIGQNNLLKYLREIGWVDRDGEPYQAQVKIGRLSRRSTSYDHPHTGEPKLSWQVRITPKGLRELHRLLGGGTPFQALASEQVSA